MPSAAAARLLTCPPPCAFSLDHFCHFTRMMYPPPQFASKLMVLINHHSIQLESFVRTICLRLENARSGGAQAL